MTHRMVCVVALLLAATMNPSPALPDEPPVLPSLNARSTYFDETRLPGIPTDAELEPAGARIGEIRFEALQLFDVGGRDQDTKLFRLQRHIVPSLPPLRNDIKKAGVTEPAYPKLPVKAAYQLAELWKLANADLARITTPLLVLTSRDDHVVEPANSERLMAGAGSSEKKQIWLEDSFHVATLDNDFPRIVEESLAFVRAHSTTAAP